MVLVSLLGDFDSYILPLYFEHKSDLSLHVLVHDRTVRDQQKARRIERGLTAIRQRYGLKHDLESMEIDEDHMGTIQALAERLLMLAPPDELYLNVSDGLANVGIILSEAILNAQATLLIYDRYDNQVNYLTKTGMKKRPIVHNMGVEDHIIAKGYALSGYKTPKELASRKADVLALTKNFALFQKLRKVLMRGKKPDDPKFEPLVAILYRMGKLSKKGRALDLNYILGELFEEYVYHLVSDLGFDDVMCGAKVHFETIDDIAIQNEFDVLMIKNNHLHVIECKFRDRVDGEYLIYKYDALLDRLDRDGRVMIVNVASTEPKAARKRGRMKRNFERGTLYRAQLNNILIYYEPTLEPGRLKQMIRRFFEV
jgi:hypothetical protein